MTKGRDRSPGILPPLPVAFDDAVKAFLHTPLRDDIKGSRAVNLKARPTKKKLGRKARNR